MNEILVYVCLAFMLIGAVLAVSMRSITKNAICLALSSAALGLIMYILGAKTAAVFEVSVCSGLITVIFISGISLSKAPKEDIQKEFSDGKRMNILPFLLIAAGVVLTVIAVKFKLSLPASAPENTDFASVFWGERNADLWGQIIIILAGGTAVSVLVKEGKKTK